VEVKFKDNVWQNDESSGYFRFLFIGLKKMVNILLAKQ
jgi:hypothetical protein